MYMYVNKLKINTKQFDKGIVADYSGQKNICLFPVPKVKKIGNLFYFSNLFYIELMEKKFKV